MTRVVPVVATLAGALLLGACGAAQSSSGADPWVACDTVLDKSAAGQTVWDASEGRTLPTITAPSVEGIGLQLSRTCDRGATLTIEPPGAATVGRTAGTTDHHLAAAIVAPKASVFDLVVLHADASVTRVHVDLGPDFTPTAG